MTARKSQKKKTTAKTGARKSGAGKSTKKTASRKPKAAARKTAQSGTADPAGVVHTDLRHQFRSKLLSRLL